jgi:hypothetical protein
MSVGDSDAVACIPSWSFKKICARTGLRFLLTADALPCINTWSGFQTGPRCLGSRY